MSVPSTFLTQEVVVLNACTHAHMPQATIATPRGPTATPQQGRKAVVDAEPLSSQARALLSPRLPQVRYGVLLTCLPTYLAEEVRPLTATSSCRAETTHTPDRRSL